MENKIESTNTESDIFICKGCNHELDSSYSLRTEGWCYLCDPNITLDECLSDKPIERCPDLNNKLTI